ncbi:peptidyl-prolyl cis-trans isomerase [Bacillus inaquosorum]|uniref:peptidyl-prolyl cis-trans isomerase n=1 Tax=Bacillus inaquosorum TaxID=483913 RepID=UPI00227FF145|nr:peptidyl-prolyl cis-trans isomerase [Bacillus inaquosorum]MCY8031849.1 peptidyl-prolyl cis-trans isomerase [Bacillus inaquosorum]MCY8796812.1 peptidyl-prolyl cis-trans isomerase [Bacillus inaquosorum]MCY8855433.1 peptidyl-prolyl cis-trans isomerase [Bacillus inaquosorum]MCY9068572.1 peptidyl-prolyl cis-trans isomerase [Bacillus inaquosorum]MEC0769813.1 peptidyl-prolyl cis-trans isomerase [Bacillus inaquosorum]
MKSRTIWTVILGVLLVCCIAVAYTLTKSQAGASPSGESIATIGGKSVTREEWLKEMEDQYGKSTLEDMINVRVVEQLAKKNDIKVSKSEIDREFLLIKAVNNSFYEDEHTTEKEWKDQIRYNILLEELLTRDIDISNSEMKSFYNKNKELYQFDDSYRIRHIVVKDEEEAREVLKELEGGSSFEAVAAERSTDRYTSPYGGDLGFVTEASDNIPSAYIEEAKTLNEDEWSEEPIKVSNGYAVIQLKEKLKARTFSYAEVKDQIRRQIAMDQLGDKATVKTLWKEADVSWFYGEKSTK